MATTDWKNLGFKYSKPHAVVSANYKNGKWSALSLQTQDTIELSVMAPCLHYGLEVFEGLKAFRSKDGKIGIFSRRKTLPGCKDRPDIANAGSGYRFIC
jgi:branched-chain amino acid aminotransferase